MNSTSGLDARVVSLASAATPAPPSASSTATPDDLLRDDAIAMYSAKRRGKGQWAFFEHGVAEHVMDCLELRAEFGPALAERQLFVEYQPVVRLDDLAIVGAEALESSDPRDRRARRVHRNRPRTRA